MTIEKQHPVAFQDQPRNGGLWVIDARPAPPEKPGFINFQPTKRKAGSPFVVQGSHFVGTTAVAVNGTAGTVKVLTANYIRVTVSAGVSSGKISVTNAGVVQVPARKRSRCNKPNARFWDALSNRHTRTTERMIKEMPNIKELLSGLRQEISDLQNMNARYVGKRVHSEVEQSALELRTTRLREIKQELSKMLDRPQDAKVWWEKSRRSSGVAIAE